MYISYRIKIKSNRKSNIELNQSFAILDNKKFVIFWQSINIKRIEMAICLGE